MLLLLTLPLVDSRSVQSGVPNYNRLQHSTCLGRLGPLGVVYIADADHPPNPYPLPLLLTLLYLYLLPCFAYEDQEGEGKKEASVGWSWGLHGRRSRTFGVFAGGYVDEYE